MSLGATPVCKTKGDNVKGNYGPVRTKAKERCLFPFLSPIIQPVIWSCRCNLPRICDSDTTCEYKPFLTLGMILIYILRRIWLPFSGGVCALSIVHAKGKELECDPNRALVRPGDLPLYGDDKQCSHCLQKKASADSIEDKGVLEETITCVRKELWLLMDQTKVIKGELAEALSHVIGSANEGLHFLRKEENFAPRMGAIGIGGLTGFVYGLRKGMFRRLLYTTIGAGTMAALCYPREAQEYSRFVYEQARMYSMIAYHFLNGDDTDSLQCKDLLPPEQSDLKKLCKCPPKGTRPHP
ncbi:uncharacterized protein Mic26-27 isoform X2 [Halyomorpha halys]|uniref:uncharacterized protein Mic26-27 isoform X2 n=1 Tax=Halyomorpha halys TaxID=286706 RepID=UPI0006D4FD34|nr:uncharacterized protein LOC106688139 isoform X2 [Halyomorpha halys]